MTEKGHIPLKNRALSNQAHQLNNLLATIKLYVQLGLRKGDIPDDLRENLGIMISLLEESKELITDMHAREQSLFRRFSMLKEGFYFVSLDGHMLDCNESFRKMLGFGPDDELQGKQLSFLWHNPAELEEFIRNLNEDGYISDMQVQLNTADGKDVILYTNAFLLKKGNGNEDAIIGTIRDITSQKETEASLRISENRFRKFIEHAPDIVTVIDGEGLIKFINHTEFDMDAESMIGRRIFDIISAEYHEEVRKKIKDTMESGRTNVYQNTVYLDGEYYWYESRLNLISSTKDHQEIIIFSNNITERKRQEEKSRNGSMLLSLLLGNLPGMAYRCLNAPGWPMEYVNEGCLELTGYHPDEMTSPGGIQFEDLILPQDRKYVNDGVQEAVSKQQPFTLEYRITTKSGEEKWVWEKGQKFIHPDGTDIYLEGFIMDITARVNAQNALKESQEKYAVAFNSSPYAMIITRMGDGYILDVNNTFELITGFSQKDIIGDNTLAINIWVDPENRKEVVNDLVNNTKVYNREYFFRKKDGTIRRALYSADLISIQHGPYILSSFFDVTESWRMEETLKETQEKLLSIFRVAPSAIGLVKDRVILEINDRIYEMTGYKPSEILGKSALMLYPTAEEFEYVGVEKYDQIKRKGIGIVESRWLKKDGSIIDIIIASTPLMPADLSRGMIFTAIDITEQKRIAEQQKKMQERLDQAQRMETIGRLAGGVAHEFNNTLQIINTYAELSTIKLDKEHPIYPYLEQIITSTKQSSGMVSQLLAFARKQTVVPEVLVLNEVIANTVEMLQKIIGERIMLSWIPGEDLWPVKMDPAQVHQVLVNLTINSRDAIKGKGKIVIRTKNVPIKSTLKFHLEEAEPGNYVMISVSDNGQGMDEATRERIFEPFFTTKEKYKGTGLGLSTVYGVVRQNGGFIYVKSAPGDGAVFEIYFPRYTGE